MFREHSRDTCSCKYRVFVGRGPNCWVDGNWYSCYYQYLFEHGHSSYYTKIEESVVSEVVEFGSDCYRFSRHPITFEPRECSANGGYCGCNRNITRLTVTCLINDIFVLQYPAMRSQCYILAGDDNVIRDGVSGTSIEHYNDHPILQQYRAQLIYRYIPLFQSHLVNNLTQWVMQCPDDIFVSDTSSQPSSIDEVSEDSNSDDNTDNATTSAV